MIPWLDLFQIHVGLFNLDLGYTSIVYFLFLYWSFLELNTVFLASVVTKPLHSQSNTLIYKLIEIFYNGLWNAVKENKKGKLNSIAFLSRKIIDFSIILKLLWYDLAYKIIAILNFLINHIVNIFFYLTTAGRFLIIKHFHICFTMVIMTDNIVQLI